MLKSIKTFSIVHSGLVSSSAQAQTSVVNHRPGILGLGLGSRVANSGVDTVLGRLAGGRLGVSAVNSAAHAAQVGDAGITVAPGVI